MAASTKILTQGRSTTSLAELAQMEKIKFESGLNDIHVVRDV